MKTKKKKGFTLTELIVVIVIIGVLAAVLIPSLTGYITKAQNAKDETHVISLNRELNLRKIEDDDLDFYTAYDVQTYLESVGMANIEVANKNNLILYDTVEEKFVLIKEDEINDALIKNEFVYHISEYYSINHHYYDEDEKNANQSVTATVMKLGYTKLSTEDVCGCGGKHRAFIISINGPEIAKAVKAVMDLPYEDNNSDLKKIIDSSSDEVRLLAYETITKTVYIDKNNKIFYYDGNLKSTVFDNSKYNYEVDKLSRVVILPEADSVNLSKINNLQQCTIEIPGTVNEIVDASLKENVNFVGNTDVLSQEKQTLKQDYNEAYNSLKIKEASYINSYISNESQLKTWLEAYDNPNITLSSKTIIIMADFSINSPHTIPYDVILYVPYDKTKTNLNEDLDGDGKADEGNPYGDTSNNQPEFAHLNSKLNKTNQVNLTINSNLTVKGKIIIGGVTGDGGQDIEGHTTGNYGEITLNGKILLETDAKLNCYGYIFGDGTIVAKSGASVLQPFIIYDFGGGSNMLNLYKKDRTPFSQYALLNIQCNTEIKYGAYFKCKARIYINTGDFKIEKEINVICPNGKDDDGLIVLESENAIATIEYDDNNCINNIGKTKIAVSDKNNTTQKELLASTGSIGFSFNLSDFSGIDLGFLSGATTIKINSSDFILPIPYNYSFIFSNGKYEINSSFALLNGSSMEITNDAELEIKNGAELYIINNADGVRFSGVKAYPTGLETAKFVVDGTVDVYGKLAGNILSNNSSESAKIVIESSANVETHDDVWNCTNSEHAINCSYVLCDKTYYICDDVYHDHIITSKWESSDDKNGKENHPECWIIYKNPIYFGTDSYEHMFTFDSILAQGTYIFDGENWKK